MTGDHARHLLRAFLDAVDPSGHLDKNDALQRMDLHGIRQAAARARAYLHDEHPATRWVVLSHDEYAMTLTDPTGCTQIQVGMNDDIGCTHMWNRDDPAKSWDDEDNDYWHPCSLGTFAAEITDALELRDRVRGGWVPPPCPHECVMTAPGEPGKCQACGTLLAVPEPAEGV